MAAKKRNRSTSRNAKNQRRASRKARSGASHPDGSGAPWAGYRARRGDAADREMLVSHFTRALSEGDNFDSADYTGADASPADDAIRSMFMGSETAEPLELQIGTLAQSPVVKRFAKFLNWYDKHDRPMPNALSAAVLEDLYTELGVPPASENAKADLTGLAVMWSWIVVNGPEPQERWHDNGDPSAMPFDVQFAIVSARIRDITEWAVTDDAEQSDPWTASTVEAAGHTEQVGLNLRVLLAAAAVGEPIIIADWERDVAVSDDPGMPLVAAETRKRIDLFIAEGILSVVGGRWALVPGLQAVVEDAVVSDDAFSGGLFADDLYPDD